MEVEPQHSLVQKPIAFSWKKNQLFFTKLMIYVRTPGKVCSNQATSMLHILPAPDFGWSPVKPDLLCSTVSVGAGKKVGYGIFALCLWTTLKLNGYKLNTRWSEQKVNGPCYNVTNNVTERCLPPKWYLTDPAVFVLALSPSCLPTCVWALCPPAAHASPSCYCG